MSKFKTGDKVKYIGNIDHVHQETEIVNYVDGGKVFVNSGGFYHDYDVELAELAEEKSTVTTQVAYILLDDSITLSFDAKMYSIAKGDHRYGAIIEAVKSGDLGLIPDLVDVAKSFSAIVGVDLVDGRIKLHGKDIPEVVSDRVLRFKEQGLPFEPLVKFAEKLMKNPSFNSRKMLYKFLEHNGHPITKDGNFIAYKGVRENFMDCHTGKFDNSVGNVVEMDRNEVDDNPDHTCSSGLHVAAFKYADGFGSLLIEVEIDPEDVVAVPNDYNGEKMRVCKYKVVNVCESRLDDVELYDDEDEIDDWYEDIDYEAGSEY